MSYKLKRIIKDVLGWDVEGRLSRVTWLSIVNHNLSDRQDTAGDLMVSLTTIPSRISRVHVTIESILQQTLRPSRVALWLSVNQFPDLRNLPIPLLIQMKKGLEIYHCQTDFPHIKLLPSLLKWPTATIVTVDDDIIYPVDWLQDLYRVHMENPDTIVCRRARIMKLDPLGTLAKYETWPLIGEQLIHPSHSIFPTGVSGVLYPPGVLHDDVHDTDKVELLCPRADDIWFKTMAYRKGTKCIATSIGSSELLSIQGSQKISLNSYNIIRGGNDLQLHAVLNNYKIKPTDFVTS